MSDVLILDPWGRFLLMLTYCPERFLAWPYLDNLVPLLNMPACYYAPYENLQRKEFYSVSYMTSSSSVCKLNYSS